MTENETDLLKPKYTQQKNANNHLANLKVEIPREFTEVQNCSFNLN